jgi:phosphohistidine phosphatase
MVNLVIMRHGEAEPLSSDDSQRQLNAKGQHEVSQMALWLQQHYAAFDWVWASPYQRTRQTAELMLAKQAPFSQLEIVPQLFQMVTPRYLKPILTPASVKNPMRVYCWYRICH